MCLLTGKIWSLKNLKDLKVKEPKGPLGWSLCEARIHNSQFKVVVKRFTATLSSNYGNHNESLRS